MSAKDSDSKESRYDSKSSGKQTYDDDVDFAAGAKGTFHAIPPKIDITSIEIDPVSGGISEPLRLKIKFELDRDCVAANWCVKFLVDSGERRVIKVPLCMLLNSTI